MFKTILLIGASAMALTATGAEALTFVYTGTVQHYTVTASGIYDVVAAGARGGDSAYNGLSGGQGIAIGAHVALTAGAILDIVVGGAGGSANYQGGGGGGSFILGGTAVVIGGGGGGAGARNLGDAAVAGKAGTGQTGGGAGGSGGSGGQGGNHLYQYLAITQEFFVPAYNGGGGAGLTGAGGHGDGFFSGNGGATGPGFVGGRGFNIAEAPAFTGGHPSTGADGGFGGGGGGSSYAGGGGGGFSGGGGGGYGFGGGGGGSFTRADATDVTATANLQADGNGFASIDLIPAAPGVPELATWGLLTGGFGMIGAAMRRSWRRKTRLA